MDMPPCPATSGGKHRELEPEAERRFEVVAVGASAGGLHSLTQLLAPLPVNFRCSVLVVQHLSPDYRSMMAQLLQRGTRLRVHQASDGESIEAGIVYVAPPNLHLLAEPGSIRLLRTPVVHHSRPSIDLLFESVAVNYGRRAVAIVLSGLGRDGADGIRAVKLAGGVTLTEDPGKAEFNSMPFAAIATGCVDMVLPLDCLAGALLDLCGTAEQHG